MKNVILSLSFVFLVPSLSFANGKAGADVVLTPAGDFRAKTDDVRGFAVQKGDTVTADNVIVNMKSLSTGLSLRDKHAKEKYLEVEKYPTMVMTKAIGKGGHGKAHIKWRGVEHDVEGTYKIKGDTLIANFPMKLSDYNISGIRYMGVGVEDEVKVEVELPLKK